MKRTYENKQIRVYWDSDKCIHSANCVRGLPKVFNRQRRPWVDVNAAGATEIKLCIDKCPSGALRCELIEENRTDVNK